MIFHKVQKGIDWLLLSILDNTCTRKFCKSNGYWIPLPKPVLILLENVLEITNGINCLANTDWSIQTKYILAMTATAFGGLSGIAQTSSMVKGTSLSMKKYCLVKLFLTLCTFLLAVAVSVFLF